VCPEKNEVAFFYSGEEGAKVSRSFLEGGMVRAGKEGLPFPRKKKRKPLHFERWPFPEKKGVFASLWGRKGVCSSLFATSGQPF